MRRFEYCFQTISRISFFRIGKARQKKKNGLLFNGNTIDLERNRTVRKFEEYEKKDRLQQSNSESYFSIMQRRLNLQMISAYIRDGSHKEIVSNESFCQRESESFSKLEKLVVEQCGEKTDEVIDQINAYSSVIEEIYFNLGMKAGVILHGKLTDNFETDI